MDTVWQPVHQNQTMTNNVLQKPSFFRFLSAIDSDLASRARLQGCSFCGGTLHSACYPRKREVDQWNLKRQPRHCAWVFVVTTAGGEQLQNRCAFSGDASILGLSWFYWAQCRLALLTLWFTNCSCTWGWRVEHCNGGGTGGARYSWQPHSGI